MKLVIAILSMVLSLSAWAGTEHDHKAPPVPKEFETLKGLVGEWEGKTVMGGKEETTTVSYKLTSGGTAIIETLSAGTPHEMVTVYSARKNKVSATHYCAIGNQPVMKLKKSDDKTFTFEMKGHEGIDSPKEMHMHSLTVTMTDKDHFKQEWTNYNNNKKQETAVFEFTRKQ